MSRKIAAAKIDLVNPKKRKQVPVHVEPEVVVKQEVIEGVEIDDTKNSKGVVESREVTEEATA
jgi:hypothetical protein